MKFIKYFEMFAPFIQFSGM